jgi:thymidylate synthase (FAD)
MKQLYEWYKEFIDAGIESEDARFILPGAACTNLMVTMNARELLHFLNIRCCRRAQWEIREIAWRMFKISRDISPVLFERAGPDCISSKRGCSEGAHSCGKPFTPDEVTNLLAGFE